MKTYGRIVVALLILTALLLAMTAFAQEKSKVTTIKQRPPLVLDTRATRATPTPTPTPGLRIPGKISTGASLPEVFRDQQKRDPQQPKMPNVIGQHFKTADSMVRERQPNARISLAESPRYSPDVKPFAVIYQSLKEGTDLKPGVEVTLVYNPQQPRPVYPKMPDLVGMDIRSAQAKLSSDAPNYPQRALEESVFNPRFKPGEVVNQSPRAGMDLQPRGVAVMYYNPQQPKVIVPDVMGLAVPDAVRKIGQNNLVARLPRRGTLDNFIVTGQSPQAGTAVEARSAVALTVAAAVVVPDVRRSLLDDAQRTISQNRLTVGSVRAQISSVRQDEVLSQSPEPNSVVVEGTTVNLVIARTQQVRVPDVLNQQQGNAEQGLTNARLTVGQVAKRESPRAAGTVLDQNPRAGTMVNIGSPVSLVIATPETVAVPDLRNRTQGNAEQVIASARLAVGQVTTRESPLTVGTVLDQNPRAGTMVNIGSPVSLVIATPETVAVPDLRNRTQGNAEQVIASARLAVGQVTTQQATVAAGTVLSQNPAAGTRITVGSRVNFVIAVDMPIPPPSPPQSPRPPQSPQPEPPKPGDDVVVPDLVKKELPEVFGLLRTVGLGVGDVKKKDEKEAASFILEQQPAAGQRVKPGTLVNLVIGKKPDGGLWKEWPKVLLVGAFGFGALLLGRLWKRLRPKPDPSPDPPNPEPVTPVLSFRSTMNANSSEFAASTDLQISFSLRFLPKADWGQQHITLTGGFVAAESEEL
ncbi:MAG: PASTA domain-containing protein [Acidobacteria bacterium]|nr:PASTA domain-containing protein [Acidobacteriota bacterium]